ncbi:Cucumisin [Handroanthus impetiginosus]|uniref:Cucumisin n=1 Tax=Handroanthus impetiginosus TaxID=429701 RepID=A0A2G9HH55_9LAMI|nr:Cucumisin [Handroanthus impetiginosus]
MLSKNILLVTFFSLCLHLATLTNGSSDNERQPYIVYMGELPENTISLKDAHNSLLSETIGDEMIARSSKIYSYGRSFNGFAARLLPHEAKLLSQKEGVVSVFPNKVQKLLTTRSWDFIGLPEKSKRNHQIESDIIVALLDTGIWVESPSFNDKGFGPPPEKWKGSCAKGANFTGCNNKVIGAQYFDLEGIMQPNETTPLDTDGHGTHTASTAAGIAVESASLYGLAKGTARGGVPSARIASYKVCWGIGCEDVDLLAAFDAAIDDGVDIISVSIGGPSRSFTEDPIAIGSFHASKKGILTVCAAGNEGPYFGTVQNVAPWIMTVAASTIDRKFETNVKLGNGAKFSGISVNTYVPKKGFYPLTNGANARNTSSGYIYGDASACDYGTLSRNKVKGKIVSCQGPGGDTVIEELGGAGTIMVSDQYLDTAFPTNAPGTYVTVEDGQRIDKYINSTRSALAVIYKTRNVNMTAPAIASFSSRGPQQTSPNILKPDIAAPGANILAAYTKYNTVTGDEGDKRVVKYNVESGTSMACPHVSGAAAYVKSFHPNWSPAAIKSALMTTSKRMKIKPVGAELASGSGQINPKIALHPGLVYDINTISYVSFLCKNGYRSKDIVLITGSKNYNCSNVPQAKGADGLNYPSIHLQVKDSKSNISAVFYRTVTNMATGKSTYKAIVKSPKGLSIKVTPNILAFDRPYQKKPFKVILKGRFLNKNKFYLSGSLVWTDSKHSVRSPILVSLPSIYD